MGRKGSETRVAGRLFLALAVVVISLALDGCASEGDQGREQETTVEEPDRLSVRDAVGQMFVVGMSGTEPVVSSSASRSQKSNASRAVRCWPWDP